MAALDWWVVAGFIAALLGVGFVYSRRAGKNVAEFFVGGRSVPWWLAGTSMLATSFASDTPLHTTKAIRENGMAQGWFYWNGIIGGVIVAFVFSKLWRRAQVVTDNEFIELRYSGDAAAWLRGGMAVFKFTFLEVLTMGWITLGMLKIVTSIVAPPETFNLFGIDIPSNGAIVALLLASALAFSMAAGFWGVVATEVIEFVVAMTGAIVLAVIAMHKVGGPTGLREGLRTATPMGESALDFTPSFFTEASGMWAFMVAIGLQWWARHEADGAGQRAQRFSSCKNENEAIAAGIWNLAVQWLIRSWPWYLTALASLVLYPHLADHETAYPRMVADLMPIGLKGLMVASFFAAFMGTMESHYNMTASYAVNDVYMRFIAKNKTEKHYVRVSRIMTLVIACLAGGCALVLPSVLGAFRFKMELVAGVGLVLVARWLWWRVNAYSEISAIVTSVVCALVLNFVVKTPNEQQAADYFAIRQFLVVLISSAVTIVVTLLTKPEPTDHLIAFYRRVRPPKWFWGPIRDACGDVGPSGIDQSTLGQSVLALIFVFGGMLGLGKVLLGELELGLFWIGVGAIAGFVGIRWVFKAPSTAPLKPVAPPPAP